VALSLTARLGSHNQRARMLESIDRSSSMREDALYLRARVLVMRIEDVSFEHVAAK
jgi:hypothetical protein